MSGHWIKFGAPALDPYFPFSCQLLYYWNKGTKAGCIKVTSQLLFFNLHSKELGQVHTRIPKW